MSSPSGRFSTLHRVKSLSNAYPWRRSKACMHAEWVRRDSDVHDQHSGLTGTQLASDSCCDYCVRGSEIYLPLSTFFLFFHFLLILHSEVTNYKTAQLAHMEKRNRQDGSTRRLFNVKFLLYRLVSAVVNFSLLT